MNNFTLETMNAETGNWEPTNEHYFLREEAEAAQRSYASVGVESQVIESDQPVNASMFASTKHLITAIE